MKAFTDLEQSKILAEILSPESADMGWNVFVDGTTRILPINDWDLIKDGSSNVKFYPAWSLTALYSVLPTIDDEFEPRLRRSLDKYFCTYEGEEDSSGLWRVADNPIDACYEMILKLHEFKML